MSLEQLMGFAAGGYTPPRRKLVNLARRIRLDVSKSSKKENRVDSPAADDAFAPTAGPYRSNR